MLKVKRRDVVRNVAIIEDLSEEETRSYEQAFHDFFKHCKIKGLSDDTILFYEKELTQIRKAFVQLDTPLDNVRLVKDQHIESFIENQLELNRAVSTINSRLRAGRTFFNYCLEKGYTKKNPFDGIKQLRAWHEIGATFSKNQSNRLLKAPNITTFIGLRDLAIMLTLSHTGIRLKELTSLHTQDVSFEGKGAINVSTCKESLRKEKTPYKAFESGLECIH